MTNTARNFARSLSNTPAKPGTVDDPVAVAFAKRLEQRGIVSQVPGLPDVDPEPWHKKVLRILHEDKEAAEQHKAKRARREAEQAEAQVPLPAQVRSALAGDSSNHMPLNGAQVLRAALGGGRGTINGEPR